MVDVNFVLISGGGRSRPDHATAHAVWVQGMRAPSGCDAVSAVHSLVGGSEGYGDMNGVSESV